MGGVFLPSGAAVATAMQVCRRFNRAKRNENKRTRRCEVINARENECRGRETNVFEKCIQVLFSR